MIKKKILLVEDDEDIRELVTEVLELEGYAVECAENGDFAIEALRRSEPVHNLILTDLNMPGKNSLQFREEYKQDPRLADVPIIIMTADDNIEAKMLEIGGKGYIRKPFSIDQVINSVRQHCR